MKPILFNTSMVQAILDGRKTVTRRVVKPQPPADAKTHSYFSLVSGAGDDLTLWVMKPRYNPEDILYVRETWAKISEWTGVEPDPYVGVLDGYIYKADWGSEESLKWHPPINMPKEAARIFLRVTDVHLERLQDITNEEAVREGANKLTCEDWVEERTERTAFSFLWDRRVKPKDLAVYSWDANPWVWAISFERCEKPDEEAEFWKNQAKGC